MKKTLCIIGLCLLASGCSYDTVPTAAKEQETGRFKTISTQNMNRFYKLIVVEDTITKKQFLITDNRMSSDAGYGIVEFKGE